eukprot:TRINITY_DN293_c0_g1_i1.p1 TRINITY_DN293_c0_g1~~TRINITY_DN293_c0_g1_i1.p1  ORF type:complete len:318 (-),score=57.04 TRINITY_DN293_c0_g1_i1:40-948(-)
MYTLFCLFFTAAFLAQGQVRDYFTTTQTGDGTYYGSDAGGSCSLGSKGDFPAAASTTVTVAINRNQYANSATCGMCVQVRGTGGGSGSNPISTTPFTAFVNNQCPGCAVADLDLGTNGDGRWDIEWIAIDCDTKGQGIGLKLQGSHDYYIKLQIRNHKIPVESVKIEQSGTWKTLVRSDDNFFLSDGSVSYPLQFPLPVQVVSIDGQTIETEFTTYAEYQDANNQAVGIQKSVQFNGISPATPSATSTPTESGSPVGPAPSGSGSPVGPAPSEAPSNSVRSANILSGLVLSLLILSCLLNSL